MRNDKSSGPRHRKQLNRGRDPLKVRVAMALFGLSMVALGGWLLWRAGFFVGTGSSWFSATTPVDPSSEVPEEQVDLAPEAALAGASVQTLVPLGDQTALPKDDASAVNRLPPPTRAPEVPEEALESPTEEARRAARVMNIFAQALVDQTTPESIQSALASQGFALERGEVSSGVTGARQKAIVVARSPQSGLVEGEVQFTGNDETTLKLESAMLVYASLKVDFATLRADLGAGLGGDGWEQSAGPTPKSTLWVQEEKGLLVSLRRFEASDPKPWEGFPQEGTVVSVQYAVE